MEKGNNAGIYCIQWTILCLFDPIVNNAGIYCIQWTIMIGNFGNKATIDICFKLLFQLLDKDEKTINKKIQRKTYLMENRFLLAFLLLLVPSSIIFPKPIETKLESCYTFFPNVNFREKPSTDSRIIKQFAYSTLFDILEVSNKGETISLRGKQSKGKWWRTSEGWVHSSLTRCIPKVYFTNLGVYNSDELPFPKTLLKNWMGLLLDYNSNMYAKEEATIVVKKAPYPFNELEMEEANPTGIGVFHNKNYTWLFHGIPFKPGKTPEFIRSEDFNLLLPRNETYRLTAPKMSIQFRVQGEAIDEFVIKDYKLYVVISGKDNLILQFSQIRSVPDLVFVGDLDSDGIPDFIINQSEINSQREEVLYLSSFGNSDFPFVPVAKRIILSL